MLFILYFDLAVCLRSSGECVLMNYIHQNPALGQNGEGGRVLRGGVVGFFLGGGVEGGVLLH